MYSPGTIKAIGLIAKGVNTDRAFAEASTIDLAAAESRLNFYSEQALKAPALQNIAVSSLDIPTPGAAAKPIASVTKVDTSTVSKTWADFKNDIVSNKYVRNTGDGEYLKSIPGAIVGQTQVATGQQKKVKPFFDERYILTPEEELEISYNNRNDFSSFIDTSLKKGQWGVTNPQQKIDIASANIAQTIYDSINKPNNNAPQELNLQTPEQIAQNKQISKGVYNSLKTTASEFLNGGNDLNKIKESKKVLDAQIDIEINRLNQANKTSQQLSQLPKGAAMDIAYSQQASDNNNIAELQSLKTAINSTYQKKAEEITANNIVSKMIDTVVNSTDIDATIKSFDSLKNTAGGLLNLEGDMSTLIKRFHPDSYMDRPLTEIDIDRGGDKVLNELALLKFNEKTNLTFAESSLETRYDKTKEHIVSAQLNGGMAITKALNDRILDQYKLVENMMKEGNSPTVSNARRLQLQSEFKKSQNTIDVLDKLIGKTDELNNTATLKSNKEVFNFTRGYIEEQEAIQAESKYYFDEDLGFGEKLLTQSHLTAKHFASGAAKLVTGVVQGLGSMTGWDSLEKAGRLATNYVSVRDLINFDNVNNKGEYQRANTFSFTNKEGETSYNPSALFFQGAEMAPLVLSTVFTGAGVTALGGRTLAKVASTNIGKGLINASRANKFNQALAATNSYGAAYRTVLGASTNPFVRALGSSVPSGMALGAMIYPAEFARAYQGMYEKGIENARTKAHAIAAVTTGIEILTENIFPDMKYLDDFAEKGLGIGKVLNKVSPKSMKKWTGDINQYRTLYGSVFGNAFTPKTLDYLATRSVNAIGKAGSASRFVLARGVEEGIEEVTAELMNYFSDNHMGLAAMKGEPPAELSVESLVNTFAGALIGPPIGIGTQLNKYNANQVNKQLFDIMLNGQHYKNKVTEAVKKGSMTQDKAAQVITKIQELESLEKEYGVKNLKNFQSNKSISSLGDLLEDPYLQYDYFTNILDQKAIADKIAKFDQSTYTDVQKADLIAQAELATSTIDTYKRRSDFYSQLTEVDKKQILDDNIKKKVQLSRMAKTETLEQMGGELLNYTAEVAKGKRPTYFQDSVRVYRDSIQGIAEEREQAELNAHTSNTYNPLLDAVENKIPRTSLRSLESKEELQSAIAQAILAPDRGIDIQAVMTGEFNNQLASLEADSESITESYLNQISNQQVGDSVSVPQEDGTVSIENEPRDPNKNEARIANLTDAQRDELAGFLAELNNQHDDLLERRDTVNKALSDAMNAQAPAELLAIKDSKVREAAISDWVTSLYNESLEEFFAVKQVMAEDDALPQSVLYDRVEYLEYKNDNIVEINKRIVEIRKQKADLDAQAQASTVIRENITIDSEVDSGAATFDVPELIPEDVTPEFATNITALETIAEETTVVTLNSNTNETTVEVTINPEHTEKLLGLLKEVADAPTLDAAKAMMAVVMQAAGESTQQIEMTLELMNRVANGELIPSVEHTHMFNMLDIAGEFTEKFINKADTTFEVNLPTKETFETFGQNATISAQAPASVAFMQDSVVKTANGTPLIIYNNTNESDARFAQPAMAGFYFTPNVEKFSEYGGLKIAAILNLKNPYYDSQPEVKTEARMQELKRQGYDGIIVHAKYRYDAYDGQEDRIANQNKYNNVEGRDNRSSLDLSQAYEFVAFEGSAVQVINTVRNSVLLNIPELTQPIVETAPTEIAVSEADKSSLEQQSKVSSTTPLVFDFKAFSQPFFATQEKIVQSIIKDYAQTKTALVDMFSIIEEVLGIDVLNEMEDIFNEMQTPNVSEARKTELYNKFRQLLPNTFIKSSVVEYIFNTQIVKKVSVSNVAKKDEFNMNASMEELIALNKNRQVSVQLANGRKYEKAFVTSKDNRMLLVVIGGKEVINEDGTTTTKDLFIPVNLAKDKITKLVYPIISPASITFADINTLVLTTIDSKGKIQKFDPNGNKSEQGKNSLFFYLPTSKNQEKPTEVQKQFDSIRMRISQGERVKQEVAMQGLPIAVIGDVTDKETKQVTQRITRYTIEFSNAEIEVPISVPNASTKLEVARIKETIVEPATKSQANTIIALEELIEASSKIPDPDRVGYIIEGNKYERQSKFVERALGTAKQVNTEDSVRNMEMGAAVGNLVDIIGRDVLGGKPVKSLKEYLDEVRVKNKQLRKDPLNPTAREGLGYELDVTPEEFDKLVKEMQDVAKELENLGWKLFTEGLIVYREFTAEEKEATGLFGVAGAMDIIAVDKEGNTHIIDFKNKKFNSVEKFVSSTYNSGTFPPAVNKWSIQQTTYAILGADFKLSPTTISILAFATEYEESAGRIKLSSVTLASNKAPVSNKYKSPFSATLISLGFHSPIITQLSLRTVVPGKTVEKITVQPTETVPTAARQLDLLIDQPKLTAKQKKARDAADKIRLDAQKKKDDDARQEEFEDEQLYMEYLQEKEAFKDLELPPEGEALSEMKVSRKSFVGAASRANLQGNAGKSIILAYIGTGEEGNGVDQVAQLASNNFGNEITENDIIDFILKYPAGIGTLNSKTKNTYYGFNNPDNNPKYSTIQNLIAKRKKETNALARKRRIESLKENLPEMSGQNIDDLFGVVTSLGLGNTKNLGRTGLTPGDITTDNINPKPC